MRINLYESFRNAAAGDKTDLPIYLKFVCAGAAGGIAQFIASPTDLAKVRMINDARSGAKPKYKNVFDCFKQLHGEKGFAGMWRGVGPNVARAVSVNFGELATYDTAKGLVRSVTGLPDSLPVHVMSAVCSGFVACACSTPFDVIKTRMMGAEQGVYKGMVDCAVQTIKHEGVLKLYSGFLPGWARLGPWQFFFWVTYEQLRKQMGMEGF